MYLSYRGHSYWLDREMDLYERKKHNLALEDKDDKIVVLLTSPMAKKVKAEHLQSLCMMCSSLPKQCPR